MSKLYDQLKAAARARAQAAADRPAAPTLLQSALHRASDPNAAPPVAEAPAPPPAPAGPAVPPSLRNAAWMGLGALLFGAWQHFSVPAVPREAPAASPRDAAPAAPFAGLKLDYGLDLNRRGGAVRSSLPDPPPSR